MKAPPWLLVSPDLLSSDSLVVLDPDEARHVSGALRLGAGREVVLADGRGRVAEAKLVTVGKRKVEAEILSVKASPKPRGEGVTLAVAVVGSKAFDWAVQKAVEVGVRAFVPVVTQRTQLAKTEVARRLDHWRRVALQSLKQCRRPWAMDVRDPSLMRDLVQDGAASAGGVVADPDGHRVGELPRNSGRLLLIGPEGGFSQEECELLQRMEWPRLRLSRNILRTETAAVVGGALLVQRDEEFGEADED